MLNTAPKKRQVKTPTVRIELPSESGDGTSSVYFIATFNRGLRLTRWHVGRFGENDYVAGHYTVNISRRNGRKYSRVFWTPRGRRVSEACGGPQRRDVLRVANALERVVRWK